MSFLDKIKNLFEKSGGRLAGPGAVSYNFDNKGFLLIKKTEDMDAQMLALIDVGADDLMESEDGIEVYTHPELLSEIRKKLLEVGFEIKEVELQMKPKVVMADVDPSLQEKIIKFLNILVDCDDVQKVYSNF